MTAHLIYSYTVFAGALTTALLSVCLLMSRAPKEDIYLPYNRARKLLGASLGFFAVGIGCFVVFPLRSVAPSYASALNLTYFFCAALLFGYSFIQLLDRSYFCRERSLRFLLTGIAYTVSIWLFTCLTEGLARRVALIVFAGWFLVETLLLVVRFFRTFSQAKRDIDNYYSDRTALFVRWLHISSWLVIVCGIAGAFLAFLPSWCNAVFMAIGIAAFTYIYISLQNYALNYERVEASLFMDERAADSQSVMYSGDVPGFLPVLEQWLGDNGFTTKGLTIIMLAEILGTNRTYLSSYINGAFRKGFGEWINGMRLEYARTLLMSEPQKSMEEIAELSGFSSQAYFSRLFKGVYGQPPLSYRRQNR